MSSKNRVGRITTDLRVNIHIMRVIPLANASQGRAAARDVHTASAAQCASAPLCAYWPSADTVNTRAGRKRKLAPSILPRVCVFRPLSARLV